jgi:hypothetical protein
VAEKIVSAEGGLTIHLIIFQLARRRLARSPGGINAHMKLTTTLIFLLTGWLSVSGAPTPTLETEIVDVDFITVISVTNVTKTICTNAAGAQVTSFVADATVERTLKGTLPKTIRVKDDTAGTMFSDTRTLGTQRFLVFLNPSGDFYVPSPADSLTAIYGTDPATKILGARWPCISLDEAVVIINKGLKK